VGFTLVRDVAPGEAVVVTVGGKVAARVCCEGAQLSGCIFEHVYLARPDSTIDGVSVHAARCRMGRALGLRIREVGGGVPIDAVIPVPDSGRIAALEVARVVGAPYREGFVKNRYVGRTFIMRGNAARVDSVRKKLSAIDAEFEGKAVLIVDDSIVRGNTATRIVAMARRAKARAVYLASVAPPVVYPNVYGIDMPARREFVAASRSVPEVAERLGVDRLFYGRLDDLVAACGGGRFDCSCFDGRYVTDPGTSRHNRDGRDGCTGRDARADL
jgi:amidophosphoribosyltransferase